MVSAVIAGCLIPATNDPDLYELYEQRPLKNMT